MRVTTFFIAVFLLLSCQQNMEEALIFSYFTGNGEDGLHLAYSRDALQWEALNDGNSFLIPDVGKDKLMRDPCIIQGPDGTFHMVWTTGWWDRHIGHASSEDLINWSEQKAIPVMEHEPEAKNCWAPELFYDEGNEQFLIFWATTIPGRHSEVNTSESEEGLNHRMYYTTTSDFENFSETQMFFNPDFSVIDVTILEQNDIYYMFVKNENSVPPEKNIRVTSSSDPAGPYPAEVSEPITGDYWAEGPTALEVDSYVYVYFDKYRQNRFGAVRSQDMENWTDISDSVSFPEGIRHGTVFKVSGVVLDKLLNPDEWLLHEIIR